MIIQLEYFSDSGKWKYNGEYESTKKDMWEVFKEVKEMRANNNLPNLSSGKWNGYIYVDSANGYPGLIKPQ